MSITAAQIVAQVITPPPGNCTGNEPVTQIPGSQILRQLPPRLAITGCSCFNQQPMASRRTQLCTLLEESSRFYVDSSFDRIVCPTCRNCDVRSAVILGPVLDSHSDCNNSKVEDTTQVLQSSLSFILLRWKEWQSERSVLLSSSRQRALTHPPPPPKNARHKSLSILLLVFFIIIIIIINGSIVVVVPIIISGSSKQKEDR